MPLISLKIESTLKAEIKSQQQYLKALESQEKNYDVDLTDEKNRCKEVISYYEKVINDAK